MYASRSLSSSTDQGRTDIATSTTDKDKQRHHPEAHATQLKRKLRKQDMAAAHESNTEADNANSALLKKLFVTCWKGALH